MPGCLVRGSKVPRWRRQPWKKSLSILFSNLKKKMLLPNYHNGVGVLLAYMTDLGADKQSKKNAIAPPPPPPRLHCAWLGGGYYIMLHPPLTVDNHPCLYPWSYKYTLYITILEVQFAYMSCCYVGQTLGKLSDYQE